MANQFGHVGFKQYEYCYGLVGESSWKKVVCQLLYLLSSWQTSLLYVLIYLLSDSLYALFLPIYGNDLQKECDSRVRATMLSVNSMFFSISMIIIFPLTGLLIDSLGFSMSFVGMGTLLIFLGFMTIKLVKE